MKTIHLAPVICRSRWREDLTTTRDHEKVTCRDCLQRIRRLHLVNPATLPDVPTLIVRETERHDGGRTVGTPCPSCGRWLYHEGGRKVGDGDGHRASHCDCWRPGGYFIREQPLGKSRA
jgi:hypothetical protein